MKLQLLLPLTIAVTVMLVVIIKTRKREHDQVDKQNRIERIKLRLTHDLLGGYQEEKMSLENQIEQSNKDVNALKTGSSSADQKVLKTKADLKKCQGALKTLEDELLALQTLFTNLEGENGKEKDSWIAELESLNKQLQGPSAICAFLKKGADSASKLCSSEGPEGALKPEEPKPEPPQPEEPKSEPPKTVETKPEEIKPEDPKPEETKL
uniref:anti-sigma-I factor RsgI8 n=1 Tax=Doryrhamphus excisus TaxID=161450 RepID=UPI0025AE53FD|nr:anti-sigma-I factor RsgI8 [Doryrhamphus excisus]